MAVGPGAASNPDEIRPGVPRVSPLRAEAVAARQAATSAAAALATLPSIEPAEPIPTYREPEGLSAIDEPGASDDEPALPDEARAREAQASAAPTSPLESQADQVLEVRFGGAAPDRLVLAMR